MRAQEPRADARAGAVFEALADPTRRAVLRDIASRGPRTATEVAADLPVSRQAVAKHLAILREAGLVVHERAGREARFTAQLAPLSDAEAWLREAGSAWDQRLRRLEVLAHKRSDGPGRE